MGVDEHDFFKQFSLLETYVQQGEPGASDPGDSTNNRAHAPEAHAPGSPRSQAS
jgi:hypothetical protein